MRRRWCAATAATVAALGAAGCGSTPLSLKDLRQDATAYCQAASRRIDRIALPSAPGQTDAFLTRGINALTPAAAGLRSLQPPGDRSAQYRTAIGAYRQELALLEATRREVRQGGDPTLAFKTLQAQLAPIQAQGNAAWESLGIPACVAR